MLYLENVLETMRDETNVIVNLSSSTAYGDGIHNPVIVQDCCGNHYVRNWLEALKIYNLHKVFIVDKTTINFENHDDSPQWVITLVTEKNVLTRLLDEAANKRAIYNSIYR